MLGNLKNKKKGETKMLCELVNKQPSYLILFSIKFWRIRAVLAAILWIAFRVTQQHQWNSSGAVNYATAMY